MNYTRHAITKNKIAHCYGHVLLNVAFRKMHVLTKFLASYFFDVSLHVGRFGSRHSQAFAVQAQHLAHNRPQMSGEDVNV